MTLTKTRSPIPSNQTAIALHHSQNPIAYFPHQNSDRPSPPINPIAYSPHQTAIAPHHPQNPIAYFSKSNSDRPSSPKTRSPIFHLKQRSPPSSPIKPDRLFTQQQTAIATHNPQNPIAYSPKSNSDRLNYRLMLRGRNSQFLEKRETSPNGIEVKFRLESKVIEFSANSRMKCNT